MTPDGVPGWLGALLLLEYLALAFTALYALCNTMLVLLGFRPAQDDVRALAYHDLDLMDADLDCPPIAVIVPAYNEERGIVASVGTLLELDYPRTEIIVVNDGSRDDTLRALRTAFKLRRQDVTSGGRLDTARVRAVYEAGVTLPERVQRLVVVDKENGGRADALNCGLNVSRSPYFVTIDADSVLDPKALKLIMRAFQDDPSVQAAGGQIGIANEATLDGGRIASVRIPRRYLPLCQTLEYVRSFTTARTGWSRLGCLMILSGAFLATRRETALAVGGFLTGRVRSRLLDEYSGRGRGTIGEDMELIVRLHRYERENGRAARIAYSPLPVCWTEVPATWKVLARQRRRWHRGFLEIMRYHGKMVLDPAYGRVGLLSLPYLALFELLGPYLEALGYLLLPVLVALQALDVERAILLAAVALGIGTLHSLTSVLCATWLEPVVPARSVMRSLLGMDRWEDRLLLVLACVLGELGYRQATVWWRLQGTWEYFRGVRAWGDMERRGFRVAKGAAAVVAAAVVASPASGAPLREASMLVGSEHREGRPPGIWVETRNRWGREDDAGPWRLRAVSAGAYAVERPAGRDVGALLGAEARLWRRAGAGLELRAAPDAETSAVWSAHFEGEAALVSPVSASWVLRYSGHADLSVREIAPGVVVYLPRDAWIALRAHQVRTDFDAGTDDALWGGSVLASIRAGRAEGRLFATTGGESYLAGATAEPRQARARSAGLSVRAPFAPAWRVEAGAFLRSPDRGNDDLTLHAGVHRRW
jgi:YaiO family outer membrane protein